MDRQLYRLCSSDILTQTAFSAYRMHRHLGLCPRLRRGICPFRMISVLPGLGILNYPRFSSPTISTVVVDPKRHWAGGRTVNRAVVDLQKSGGSAFPLGCECGARIARKHQKTVAQPVRPPLLFSGFGDGFSDYCVDFACVTGNKRALCDELKENLMRMGCRKSAWKSWSSGTGALKFFTVSTSKWRTMSSPFWSGHPGAGSQRLFG